MKWFKHMTETRDDEKLCKIMTEYGPMGYGVYWIVMEMIAKQVDKTGLDYVTYPEDIWKRNLMLSTRKLTEVFSFFARAEIFSVSFEKKGAEKSQKTITVTAPNILKYRDEWSRKKARNSGVTPESLRSKESESEREEEEEDKKKDSLSVSREERESCFAESESSDLKKHQPQNREPDHPEDHGFSNTEVGFAILSTLKIDPTPWEMGHRSFARLQRWIGRHSLEEVLDFVERNEASLMGKGDPFAYADTFIDREIAEATGKVRR